MSSTNYHFGWNWNSGVSAPAINLIGTIPCLCGLHYTRGSNVSDGLPLLGGINPTRSSSFPRGSHVSRKVPFPRNVDILGSYHFPRVTYPLTDVWKHGGNYFPKG